MSESIRGWANAGLPLALTFIALGKHPVGATAESVAESSTQDVREVRVHLEQFLLPNGFALCSTAGVYALTKVGLAKLNDDAPGLQKDHPDTTRIALRYRSAVASRLASSVV